MPKHLALLAVSVALIVTCLTGCLTSKLRLSYLKYIAARDEFRYLVVYRGIHAVHLGTDYGSDGVQSLAALLAARDKIAMLPTVVGPDDILRWQEPATLFTASGVAADFDLGSRPNLLQTRPAKAWEGLLGILPGDTFADADGGLSYYHEVVIPGVALDGMLRDEETTISKTLSIQAAAELERRKKGDTTTKWTVLKENIGYWLVETQSDLAAGRAPLNDEQVEASSPLSWFDLETLAALAATDSAAKSVAIRRKAGVIEIFFRLSRSDVESAEAIIAEIRDLAKENGVAAIKRELIDVIKVRRGVGGLIVSYDLVRILEAFAKLSATSALTGPVTANVANVAEHEDSQLAASRELTRQFRAKPQDYREIVADFQREKLRASGYSSTQEQRNAIPQVGFREPLDLEAFPDADERLFLMRLLEQLYCSWPGNTKDSAATLRQLASHRDIAESCRSYLERKQLDESLEELFKDMVKNIDLFGDFLVSVGRIERDAIRRHISEAAKTGFDSGFKGGVAGATAKANGASSREAIGVGAAIAITSLIWDEYNNSQKREAAKADAVADEVRRLDKQLATAISKAKATGHVLADKYGWKSGEAGFDADASADRIQSAYAEGSFGESIRLLQEAKERRPRDPFVIQDLAIVVGVSAGTRRNLEFQARECIRGSRLVPKGSLYSPYRLALLEAGARLASMATATELKSCPVPKWGSARLVTAPLAIQLWEARLSDFASDPDGSCRAEQAWTLARAGAFRSACSIAESVREARSADPDFAYNMACLYSLLKESDVAFEWFKWSVANNGHEKIASAKQDVNLANLRSEKQIEFDEFIKPRPDVKLKPGVLWDEIVCRNNSPFTMSHVKVTIDANDKSLHKVLSIPLLPPGKTETLSLGQKAAPNSRLDYSVTCDQD